MVWLGLGSLRRISRLLSLESDVFEWRGNLEGRQITKR